MCVPHSCFLVSLVSHVSLVIQNIFPLASMNSWQSNFSSRSGKVDSKRCNDPGNSSQTLNVPSCAKELYDYQYIFRMKDQSDGSGLWSNHINISNPQNRWFHKVELNTIRWSDKTKSNWIGNHLLNHHGTEVIPICLYLKRTSRMLTCSSQLPTIKALPVKCFRNWNLQISSTLW